MDALLKYLPLRISRILAHQSDEFLNSITEIRLRELLPFSVSIGRNNYTFNQNGEFSSVGDGIICTSEEISHCLERLCAFSLYSFEDTIKKGYIPLENGCRAGVCGECVTSEGKVVAIKKITAINIRISHQKKNFAGRLFEHYQKCGISDTLILSPPSFGKTTLLKSIASLLSEADYKVAIVDERLELFTKGMSKGLIDVINGCPKAFGIELLTRTMSPDVIICDEISPFEEHEINNAHSSGVVFIASLHARNVDDAARRPFVRSLLTGGGVETFVVLKEGYSYDIVPRSELKYYKKDIL